MTVRQVSIVDRDFLSSEKAFRKKSCAAKIIQSIYDVFCKINYFLKRFFIEHFASRESSIEKLINRLAENRIAAMQDCSKKFSIELLQDKSDLKDSSEEQIQVFIDKVIFLKNLIEKKDIKIVSEHSNDIRKEIDEILEDEVYKKNKNSNCPAVNFLQELCNCIFLKSKGSDEISEYAQTIISIDKPICSFKDLGSNLDAAYKKEKKEPNRDRLSSTLKWVIASPIKSLNVLLTRILPLETNQYQINNNEIAVQDYVFNKSGTRFYHG
ncbi:MAG: hypothetical protein WCT85_07300, partial [Parachlamydiales bacterium]